MGRAKLKRYSENADNSFIIEDGKELYNSIKGNWREKYFKNDNPIVLELACGKGEYTVGMAPIYPDKNFIGVDLKGSRLWKGATISKNLGLSNVAFLRTQIQNIENFFDLNEVDEIWITFPDPRPKNRDEKRRLTSHYFFEKYLKLLKRDGFVHLKTDNSDLFDYTLNSVRCFGGSLVHATKNLYSSPLYKNELTIKTTYEIKFTEKGFKINYTKFRIS